MTVAALWYMCVTLAYHPHEEKRQLFLNSSFQFIPAFALHGKSQGISLPSNGHNGCTLQIFTQPLGCLIWFHISFPVCAGGSLVPQKVGDQAVYSYFFVHSVQILCLTFINPSMITNMSLLAELEHILKIFSSSWQHSWSSSVSRALRFEQLGQYFAICVDGRVLSY